MRTIAKSDLSLFQAFGNTCAVTVVFVRRVELFIGENTLSRMWTNILDTFIIYNVLYSKEYFLNGSVMLLAELQRCEKHVRNIFFIQNWHLHQLKKFSA